MQKKVMLMKWPLFEVVVGESLVGLWSQYQFVFIVDCLCAGYCLALSLPYNVSLGIYSRSSWVFVLAIVLHIFLSNVTLSFRYNAADLSVSDMYRTTLYSHFRFTSLDKKHILYALCRLEVYGISICKY